LFEFFPFRDAITSVVFDPATSQDTSQRFFAVANKESAVVIGLAVDRHGGLVLSSGNEMDRPVTTRYPIDLPKEKSSSNTERSWVSLCWYWNFVFRLLSLDISSSFRTISSLLISSPTGKIYSWNLSLQGDSILPSSLDLVHSIHSRPVFSLLEVRMDHDGRPHLLTSSMDRCIVLWDIQRMKTGFGVTFDVEGRRVRVVKIRLSAYFSLFSLEAAEPWGVCV
jgi:hypothetical protein